MKLGALHWPRPQDWLCVNLRNSSNSNACFIKKKKALFDPSDPFNCFFCVSCLFYQWGALFKVMTTSKQTAGHERRHRNRIRRVKNVDFDRSVCSIGPQDIHTLCFIYTQESSCDLCMYKHQMWHLVILKKTSSSASNLGVSRGDTEALSW